MPRKPRTSYVENKRCKMLYLSLRNNSHAYQTYSQGSQYVHNQILKTQPMFDLQSHFLILSSLWAGWPKQLGLSSCCLCWRRSEQRKYMDRSMVWSLLTNSSSSSGLHINNGVSIQAPYMASLYLLEYTVPTHSQVLALPLLILC